MWSPYGSFPYLNLNGRFRRSAAIHWHRGEGPLATQTELGAGISVRFYPLPSRIQPRAPVLGYEGGRAKAKRSGYGIGAHEAPLTAALRWQAARHGRSASATA